MSERELPSVSKSMRWISYILSALPILFLAFSASSKFLKPEGMELNVEHLGWKMDQMTALGFVETACIVVYLIPRTAVFGAVLLTAYLGGATATHARIGEPFIIPVLVGVVLWVGLYLREPRLWSLAPIRVEMRSMIGSFASFAGTKLPTCAINTAIATCRINVDLPAMLGPVRSKHPPG